jgi:predicted transcriptional regulator
MLLSLKPEIFELIRSGQKIFEYRHQFYTEAINAYLYISKPVQKIVGYIEFGKRINLQDWKEKYKDNSEVSDRIDDYISRNYKYAMPVNKFRMTTEIPLTDLKNNLNKFIIPESYYYLDNFIDLNNYINSNIEFTGEVVENNFEIIKEADICRKRY